MNYDFSGRNAIVTGGANGISLEVAKAFNSAGARTFILDLDERRAESVINEFSKAGGKLEFRKVDMSRDSDVIGVFTELEKEIKHVDILFNGAGIMDSNSLRDTPAETFRKVLDVNLFGTYNACRTVINGMVERGFGRIINVTSAYANGVKNAIGYAASKGAITSLTRSLAAEMKALDLDITVNAISPPATDTALWRRTRSREIIESHLMAQDVGQPGDMVSTVLFLASPEAFFVSGEIMGHKYALMKVPDSRT